MAMLLFSVLALLYPTVYASLAFRGVDWSSLLVQEAAGRTYKNAAGTVQPLETILKNGGVDTVRQRLWVNPSDGNYNLTYNVKLAKRAQAAGLQIYLDMHFSDTWADSGHQATPAALAGYAIDDLAWEVYNYTLATMNTFQSNGIPLSIVSIGNEINAGMLWPLGATNSSTGLYNLARLLHSASAGIKDSALSTKPRIMIHLANGWNWATQQRWYDTVLAEGPLTSSDYDIQGVSYYPFYNSDATLASLRTSLTNMRSKYGKEVMVVETNWPTWCPSPAFSFPADTTSIPFSVAGQARWVKDVASKVTSAGGVGLIYWEPAWIDSPNLGSSCAFNLMVTSSGVAMASLAVFRSI